MIKRICWQNEDYDANKQLSELEQTAWEALEDFVVYDLGSGGLVSGLLENKITVETDIEISGWSKNTITIEGPKEEMAFIIKLAAHHVSLTGGYSQRNRSLTLMADELLATPAAGMTPLDAMYSSFSDTAMKISAEMLIGEILASVALLFSVGMTDEKVVKTLLSIPLKNLVAAIKLSRETAKPLTEIVREQNLTSV